MKFLRIYSSLDVSNVLFKQRIYRRKRRRSRRTPAQAPAAEEAKIIQDAGGGGNCAKPTSARMGDTVGFAKRSQSQSRLGQVPGKSYSHAGLSTRIACWFLGLVQSRKPFNRRAASGTGPSGRGCCQRESLARADRLADCVVGVRRQS